MDQFDTSATRSDEVERNNQIVHNSLRRKTKYWNFERLLIMICVFFGKTGDPCKHQGAVIQHFNVTSSNFIPTAPLTIVFKKYLLMGCLLTSGDVFRHFPWCFSLLFFYDRKYDRWNYLETQCLKNKNKK